MDPMEQLRLDLTGVPWDEGRTIVLEVMRLKQVTRERLHIELYNRGWEHSYTTLRRWFDPKNPGIPDIDEVRLLTEVLTCRQAS